MTTSTQFRLTLVIVLGFFHSLTFAQAREGNGVAHGTVNIFLGNENGLVAITDSRLSSGNRPVGYGQKLFKLDDHTVCAIAGFFSAPGPTFKGNSPNPAGTAIPYVLNGYIRYGWPRESGSLANRFYSLAKTYVVALNLMEEIQRIAGLPPVDTPSIITIAGYEKGSLWVGQVALTPIVVNGAIQYELPTELPILKQVVGGHLTRETAGIDSLALELLNNPAPHADYDPIFGIYAKSEAANGTPLTLDELKTLANRIERMTADKYRNYVGGEPQVAVLADEKASLLPHPIPLALPERESTHANE